MLTRSPTRVLVAEDDVAFREALVELVSSDPALEVIAVATDAVEAVELATRHRPDVALVDIKMPRGGGPAAAQGIQKASSNTKIVVLSAHEDRQSVLEMIRAGAIGYVVKGSPVHDILQAIRASASGQGALSDNVTSEVVRELATRLERGESKGRRRREWAQRLDSVLHNEGHLSMVFQPIVRLGDGEAVGFEALARFTIEPPAGPDAWFAEAEELGRRVELELLALRAALHHRAELPPRAWLSVNLSPGAVLSDAFANLVDQKLARGLVVELTEHAKVDDYVRLNERVKQLRSAAGRIAIDDAGAGYASLRHILDLAPDFIKLDMSLTRDIDTHQPRHALARALIAFSSETGAPLIAEGIETPSEVSTLLSLGVSYGQGYHFARPGPLPAHA